MDGKSLPNHVAIIMDGNGRWAKKRGLPRSFGHRQGVASIISLSKYCAKIGLNNLTLYAFSTENWNRPQDEIDYIMKLIEANLKGISKKLLKQNIRLRILGEEKGLSEHLKEVFRQVEIDSMNNSGLNLNICFNYGSKDEIIHAIKEMINENEEITKENLSNHLYTKHSGDVDLLIRTSGEERISNFLLWQIAYSELYFTSKYWPEFSRHEFDKAIDAYNKRNRRFGGIKDER